MDEEGALYRKDEGIGLLAGSSNQSEENNSERQRRQRTTVGKPSVSWALLVGILIISIAGNAVQFWLQSRTIANGCRSTLTGSTPNVASEFGRRTAWGDSSNLTALDERWYGMDLNKGIVQLPKSDHLGSTENFPWDDTRGLYMLNGYHSLHCLRAIYGHVREYQQGLPLTQTDGHITHCLDTLRSDILCQADDTPRPFGLHKWDQLAELPPKRLCRNWDKLADFAIENSGCIKRHEPGHPLYDTLVEYTFCPPSSPYYDLVQGFKTDSKAKGSD